MRVLTAGDLPIVATGEGRLYQPLAREEVVYAGQPVAIVVAESEAIAEDAAALVEVDLDPLDAVLDVVAASAGSTPPIDTPIVEVPSPDGPYGAKGVAEAPVAGVPGAVANAIAAATGGARVGDLPITAERVWRAMAARGDQPR